MPEICLEAVALLTAADVALEAVPVLALLREAAAMGAVTQDHILGAQAMVSTISREERFFAHDDVRFRAAGAPWSGDCLA